MGKEIWRDKNVSAKQNFRAGTGIYKSLSGKYRAAESGAGEPLHGCTDGDVLCDDAATGSDSRKDQPSVCGVRAVHGGRRHR